MTHRTIVARRGVAMRKLVLLLAVGVALAIGMAAQDSVPPTPPKDTSAPPKPADESCAYRSAEEIVKEWQSNPRQSVDQPPQCPAEPQNCSSTNTCAGSNPCGISGGFTSTDTGLDKCRLSDGSLVNCSPQHQTVHVRTAPCAQCPCCTAQPFPCLCPQQCAQITQLVCE
jgi:hypothetical protein